jgi:hypothetical protein
MPSAVSGLYPCQFLICSSDRKRFMVLQAWGRRCIQFENGTDTYPVISSGSARRTTPSRISRWTGSPQSRQGASIVTTFPGNSQQTASDSKPH